MNGWYKQQRNLSERPWYKDSQMVQLYHYLKERAYVADGQFEGKIIRRGSCPITRSEIMEVTGMSYRTLDRVLRRLISFGEIIVKGNNRFSVITICDYDGYDNQESLFGTAVGTTDGTTDGIAAGTTVGTTHLSTIEERRNNKEDILVSPYSSYKKDKDGLAYEIKERWNRMAEGKLNQVQRLTMPTKMAILACMERFGKQSIDLVFEQVLLEHEKTGFVASFQFVTELVNYQGYLKRAQIRISKKSQPQQEQKKSVGTLEDNQPQQSQRQSRREYILSWVEAERKKPTERGQKMLQGFLASGELDKYGININFTESNK